MFKIRKKFLGVMLTLMMVVLTIPVTCRADGTTTIRVSDGSPSVGDGISVNVAASESDNISVKYNPDVLQLTGASQEYGIEGNTITFQGTNVTLQFKATAVGKSSIIVSGTNVTGSSTSIQVGDEDTGAAKPEQTTGNTTSAAEGQFTVDGTAYVVSERFSDEEIPSGFEIIRVTIDGYAYKALSNGSITLIYLKPAADTSGKGVFYNYDTQANAVSTFAMLGGADAYVLLATPDTMLMEGLQQKEITVSEHTISVYALGDSEDFYFVYGTDQKGTTGWYQYDAAEGTVQRVNEQLLGTTTVETQTNQISNEKDAYYDKWAKQRYLLAGLLFIIVVLLVLVVNLFLSRRRAEAAMWENDEDEDTEEEVEEGASLKDETEEFTPTNGKTSEAMMEDKTTSESFAYRDIKGTEAFLSNKETRYKSRAEEQLDIMDLNDL